MVKSSIEKLSDPIGFEIGMSDDVTQANLLNGFCRGIANSIPNERDFRSQVCAIVERLDGNSDNVIKEIAAFIKLKENNGHNL